MAKGAIKRFGRQGKWVAAAIVIAVVVLLVRSIFAALKVKRLDYTACFYYVYYRTENEESSATSVSVAVQSYGGAGHIVSYGGKYYITISCYYTQIDADKVCANLKLKNIPCDVLAAQVDGYDLATKSSRNNSGKYKSNLTTLYTLSELCYNTANGMDGGEVDSNGAKTIIYDVKKTLNGLLKNNLDNCFTDDLNYLLAECEDITAGYIYSRDVRRLQIAITDCILNIKFD